MPNALSILKTTDGKEKVLFFEKRIKDYIFFSTEGKYILFLNATFGYIIPHSLASQAREAFENGDIEAMVSRFTQGDTKIITERVLWKLIFRPEVAILEKAARVLGEERNVIGRTNKGALLFYATLLNWVNVLRGEYQLHKSLPPKLEQPSQGKDLLQTMERGKRSVQQCTCTLEPGTLIIVNIFLILYSLYVKLYRHNYKSISISRQCDMYGINWTNM